MPMKRDKQMPLVIGILALGLAWAGCSGNSMIPKTKFSGYAKSLNFYTRTTGLSPETADNPAIKSDKHSDVFDSMERFRLKSRTEIPAGEGRRVSVKIDYDHQANFGSFVHTGDFRIARNQVENQQFLDLSHTLANGRAALYEHRLYRASTAYEGGDWAVEVGRQQIPWGVGRFFTPTDLFNPFNPTQLEPEERDGVDAANGVFYNPNKLMGVRGQFVYTPRGRRTHPQRFAARVSKDKGGYELGLLGAQIHRDQAFGFDIAGNVKSSAVRGEFLFRQADLESDFIKFTLNADYNFPHNIYALAEYHFNGQGRHRTTNYQMDRWIYGDIQQLARNYAALSLGYDVTPLIRFENRAILNMDDVSSFIRPEIRYEIRQNLLVTVASEFFLGGPTDEYGLPCNVVLSELRFNF